MPVVLVEVGGVARSGHEYGDRTGVEYEYPAGRYENWIATGDRFVYQVPGSGYTGSGVVGQIRPSPSRGRLICDVLEVQHFKVPVPLKNPFGKYYEADPTFWKDRVYWGQGVRPLTNQRFEAIVRAAGSLSNSDAEFRASTYAGRDNAIAVEEYSIAVAMDLLNRRFGGEVVEVMPHSNPGFDIRVGPATNAKRYIEVKGTQTASPTFFMSEGERQFSIRNADSYTLIVVSGINLEAREHSAVTERDGAVVGAGFDLTATQWRGTVV